MAPFNHRKRLEADLESAIRGAEKETLHDPQLKSMVQQLRNLYRSDKDEFLFMLEASPPPNQKANTAKRQNLPPSKIPQLIAMLDALATNKPLPVLPSIDKSKNGMPPPLVTSLPHPSEFQPAQKAKDFSVPKPKPIPEASQIEIEKINVEIRKLRALYDLIKKDEDLIKKRKKKYAIPFERLKAERLLRELPEQIRHLIHKRKMYEDGLF